ncbi:MAG: alpha/beta fold hydrolase, partial [Pseudomonadales bacterium]
MRRPLNPDATDNNGATVELQVARIRSLAPAPARDAFTIINGGPGGSSLSLYADLGPVFSGILRERDIIIVDQRGTGRSTKLTCPKLESSPQEIDPETIAGFAKDCVDELPADPRFFSTSVAVKDLEALRAQLRYRQLTIYGVSYGTRVAQHYARQYPKRTRALVIDGVLPAPMTLGPQIARNAQQVLDSIFARCSNDAACNAAFPNLQREFTQLQQELQDDPKEFTLAHPITGQTETMELEYGHLAVVLRLLSYAPETGSLIPLLIHETATSGNYLPLAAQALK